MKICVLSSGSKGNSSVIFNEKTKILIDDGLNLPYIEDSLKELNISIKDLDGILITHEHDDHIKGLKKLISKYDPLLYVDSKLYEILSHSLKDFRYVLYDENIVINDIKIDVLKMSHDSVICNGFIFKDKRKELVYITDTGYINRKHLETISNKDMYVIESNHDIEMLENGPYPYFLKQRVISDRGHLSNMQTSKYLKKVIGPKTKNIMFIHLSEKNNKPELVIETF
ncbi:MAG: MBL fold metallo-hydrolase, partial [Bacilli bacterium]|nr:MBL fold metallo-hydrolase [Bacilli bacterium]